VRAGSGSGGLNGVGLMVQGRQGCREGDSGAQVGLSADRARARVRAGLMVWVRQHRAGEGVDEGDGGAWVGSSADRVRARARARARARVGSGSSRLDTMGLMPQGGQGCRLRWARDGRGILEGWQGWEWRP